MPSPPSIPCRAISAGEEQIFPRASPLGEHVPAITAINTLNAYRHYNTI